MRPGLFICGCAMMFVSGYMIPHELAIALVCGAIGILLIFGITFDKLVDTLYPMQDDAEVNPDGIRERDNIQRAHYYGCKFPVCNKAEWCDGKGGCIEREADAKLPARMGKR